MPEPFLEINLPGIPAHRLLLVPGGEFRMGSTDDDKDAQDNEKPAHRARVNDFYLGEFPVTQDLWEAVTGKNPTHFNGPRRPVESVSFNDIQDKFLPLLQKKTGHSYRLPTEAEWEYAARGGPFWGSEGYRYAGSDLLEQVGWYKKNSGGETCDVGLLLPNALGLYDLSGNVWELCTDTWHGGYKGAPEDGSAWDGGQKDTNVLRGGSWYGDSSLCRVTRRFRNSRFNKNNIVGFRLVKAVATEDK